MTDKRSVDEVLNLLGYSDYKMREALLDVFYIFDSLEFDDETRERLLRVGIEVVTQNQAKDIPDKPEWTPFVLGLHKTGDIARVKDEGYEGKSTWHLGKVGRIVAVRSGRVVVQYIGRSDGVGHYHHPDMIEVLKNG